MLREGGTINDHISRYLFYGQNILIAMTTCSNTQSMQHRDPHLWFQIVYHWLKIQLLIALIVLQTKSLAAVFHRSFQKSDIHLSRGRRRETT